MTTGNIIFLAVGALTLCLFAILFIAVKLHRAINSKKEALELLGETRQELSEANKNIAKLNSEKASLVEFLRKIEVRYRPIIDLDAEANAIRKNIHSLNTELTDLRTRQMQLINENKSSFFNDTPSEIPQEIVTDLDVDEDPKKLRSQFNWKWVTFVGILILGGTIAFLTTGIIKNPFEANLVMACEAAVKGRLKSPSTYKRVYIHRNDEILDLEGSLPYLSNKSGGKDEVRKADELAIKSGLATPILFKLSIEYDASNAFGAVIRSKSECEYFSLSGSDEFANAYSVDIDGINQIDYLQKSIENSR